MTGTTPTGENLSRDDLIALRNDMNAAYLKGTRELDKEFERGRITPSRYVDGTEDLQELRRKSTKLLGLIMDMDLDHLQSTDISSPRSRIAQAITKLNNAADRIEKFLDFLSSLAEVISIAAGLVVAIQTGNIARISSFIS